MTVGRGTEHLCTSECTMYYLHVWVVICMTACTEARAREATDGEVKQSREEEGGRVRAGAQSLPGWILILKRMWWVEKTQIGGCEGKMVNCMNTP